LHVNNLELQYVSRCGSTCMQTTTTESNICLIEAEQPPGTHLQCTARHTDISSATFKHHRTSTNCYWHKQMCWKLLGNSAPRPCLLRQALRHAQL